MKKMTATPIKSINGVTNAQRALPETRDILNNITMMFVTADKCNQQLWRSPEYSEEIKERYKSIRHRAAETLKLIDDVIAS
jgi:hypothetical protein